MARKQKKDSQQEVAVTSEEAESNKEMYAAINRVKGSFIEVPTSQLVRGMFIVTHKSRDKARAMKAMKVKKVEWSRKRNHCVVNNRFVYSYGGFAEVLGLDEAVKL